MLKLLNKELRRLPGITDKEWENDLFGVISDETSGVRHLDVHQNHGIRAKNVSSDMKQTFKKYMPEIIKILPGMESPFNGHIEFHSVGLSLKEVHFFPKP
jgi:hypothetical protein